MPALYGGLLGTQDLALSQWPFSTCPFHLDSSIMSHRVKKTLEYINGG